jgi:hypothetical protein
MEEVPKNGKESLHSAHANGMNEWMNESKMRCKLKIMFLSKEQATHSKLLLIQSQLIQMLDNPAWQI